MSTKEKMKQEVYKGMEDAYVKLCKEICPDQFILKRDDEGTFYTKFMDEEMDVFTVYFNNDGCFEIQTKGYEYITINPDVTHTLTLLMAQAEYQYSLDPIIEK